MNSPAITSTELHSMIGHGLVHFKPASVEAAKQPKVTLTKEQKRVRWRQWFDKYKQTHADKIRQWHERGRLKAKAKRKSFIAAGLNYEGKPRRRHPRPELAGMDRKEYRRNWMRLRRKQSQVDYEI